MKRNNGEGTIYHIKSKNIWSAQISIGKDENGKLIRKTVYGKTRKEVQDKLFETQAHVVTQSMRVQKKITLNQWIEEYFRSYKVHTMKKTTYEKEFGRFKSNIYSSELGNQEISSITSLDIQHFINDLQFKKGLAGKTISNIMIIINSALKQAEAERIILKNPCITVKKPKIKKPNVIALDELQIAEFKKAIENNPYRDIYIFAMQTGMREAEICGLTNDCIDLNKKEITVNKQLVRLNHEYVLETPKTENSIRIVPMTNEVYNICKKYISKEKYLFKNPISNRQLISNALCCSIKRVFKSINYDIATFHSLRHTFATHFLRCGGNVIMLAKILGHSDANFTIRTYIQPSSNDIHDAINKIKF